MAQQCNHAWSEMRSGKAFERKSALRAALYAYVLRFVLVPLNLLFCRLSTVKAKKVRGLALERAPSAGITKILKAKNNERWLKASVLLTGGESLLYISIPR